MKLFKDWKENSTAAFVIFLGKEAIKQRRRMRILRKEVYEKGDMNAMKQYDVQCGAAMQSYSLFNIAIYHFELDRFKRKHMIKTE